MVSDVVHLNTTISQRIKHEEEEKDDEDTCSVSTTSTDNCDGGAVVLQDTEDRAPCFQNIEVTNSSDVHFGNKTYYQGPVTIKQVLYTNRDGEKSQHTNGLHPPLAINDNKCAVDNVSYANYNDGYTTDNTIHHITSNGQTKLPNGIHDHFEPIRGGSNGQKFTKNQWLLIGLGVTLAMMLIVTAVALIFTLKPSESSNENLTENSPILEDPEDSDSDYVPVLPPGLRLIARSEWLAAPPRNYTKLKTPVDYVVILHTVTEQCRTLALCKYNIISMQQFHMNSFHCPDIVYNFLVGGDGYSYEGRGWTKVGQHTAGYDSKSIGIALIGNFENILPSEMQMQQTKELIKYGVEQGFIKKDYKLIGVRRINPMSSCPTCKLTKELEKWPNYIKSFYGNIQQYPTGHIG